MDPNNFPSRKNIIETVNNNYQNSIIDAIKQYDIDKVDFKNSNYDTVSEISEKQKTYFWIRVYLKEEDNILNPNDDISIKYNISGEELECKFICYNKKGLDKDNNNQVTNYSGEDDKKVLCLMVDSDRINGNSSDIPFIRSLFKIGRYYEYQLMRRDDLNFIDKKSGSLLEYFDADF